MAFCIFVFFGQLIPSGYSLTGDNINGNGIVAKGSGAYSLISYLSTSEQSQVTV